MNVRYSNCFWCGAPIKREEQHVFDKVYLYWKDGWIHYYGDGDYYLCDNPTDMAVNSGYERKQYPDPNRVATHEAVQERLI